MGVSGRRVGVALQGALGKVCLKFGGVVEVVGSEERLRYGEVSCTE